MFKRSPGGTPLMPAASVAALIAACTAATDEPAHLDGQAEITVSAAKAR